jgi:hypothetical protein
MNEDDMNMQEYLDKYCTPKDLENYEDFAQKVCDPDPSKSVPMIRAWMKVNLESFLAPIGNN